MDAEITPKMVMPSYEMLQRDAEKMPAINPTSVLLMLSIMETATEIQHKIHDVLERDFHISIGNVRVIIILYQHENGLSPSLLAEYAGVTRATISVMLKRMKRDGLVEITSKENDGRSKIAKLTDEGRSFAEEMLPQHYLRISKMMQRLTSDEQMTLVALLQKLGQSE